MHRFISIFAIATATYFLQPSGIYASPSFLEDRKNGCKLWTEYDSSKPGPREFEWDGKCVDGFAEGYGKVTYFADGEPYWEYQVTPQSGAKIVKGNFKYNVPLEAVSFKLTGCKRNKIQTIVKISDGLDLKFPPIFWKVVGLGSKFLKSQTIVYRDRKIRNPFCSRYTRFGNPWKREKEVIIFQNGQQLGWARTSRGGFIGRQKGYEYEGELWSKWSNHSYIKANNQRVKVLNAVIKKQNAARKKQRRLEKAIAERERREAIQRKQLEIKMAEEARQKEIMKKFEELTALANNDAAQRDKERPADSFCLLSCNPLERHGRLLLTNKIKDILKIPTVITKFRKTNGVNGETNGIKTYEMHFSVVIEVPAGFGPKEYHRVDEVQKIWRGINSMNSSMNLRSKLRSFMQYTIKNLGNKNWDPHTITGTGKLKFRKTEQGWEGSDGVVYK